MSKSWIGTLARPGSDPSRRCAQGPGLVFTVHRHVLYGTIQISYAVIQVRTRRNTCSLSPFNIKRERNVAAWRGRASGEPATRTRSSAQEKNGAELASRAAGDDSLSQLALEDPRPGCRRAYLRPDRLRDPKPALTRRAERPGSTAQPYGRGSGHQASKKNSRRSPQLGLLHLNLPSWAKHGPGLGPEPHLTRRPELAAARRCLCATHGRTPSREPLISAFALGVSYPSRGLAAVAAQSTQHTAGPLQSSGLLHRCESYLGGVLFCSTPKPPLYPPGGAFEMRVHQVPVKMLREITDA